MRHKKSGGTEERGRNVPSLALCTKELPRLYDALCIHTVYVCIYVYIYIYIITYIYIYDIWFGIPSSIETPSIAFQFGFHFKIANELPAQKR